MEHLNRTLNYSRTLNLFILLILLFLILLTIPSSLASGMESKAPGVRRVIGPSLYTRQESFSIQCARNETALLETAILFRGTDCTDSDKCHSDVTARLDALCTASSQQQQSCQVSVQSLCNGTCGAAASLNVTYSCVQVVTRDCRQRCPTDETSRLTAPEGYLTSDTTLTRQCGTADCPWNVQVPPGQNIEVTMYDLSGARSSQGQRGGQGPRTQNEYSCVVVKERANPKEIRECATGRTRQRVVHTTISNTVELRIDPKEQKFILRYRAIGCPDIVPPYNSRMKRNGDLCEIDCPGSDLRWTLRCVDNKWEGAEKMEKCPGRYFAPGALPNTDTTDSGADVNGASSSVSSMPMSILIAAVIAITVIITVLVLTIGFVCLKKHHYETKPGDPMLYGAPTSEFEFCTDFTPVRPGQAPKPTGTMQSGRPGPGGPRRSVELLGPMRDNTYAADRQLLEMQPLHRPLPMVPGLGAVTDGGSSGMMPNDQKRIIVQLHHTGSGGAGGTTRSVIAPYPTMMMMTMRDGRMLPCNCGGGATPHHHLPSQQPAADYRPPSHLYFTLDPEVQADEPATLGRGYPAIEQGVGGEGNDTLRRAHHLQSLASPPPPSEITPQRAGPVGPYPPEPNHAMEMVPLNLTSSNRAAKHGSNHQAQDNAMYPLNLTPPHKLGPNSRDVQQNFQPPRQKSSIEAHS